MNIEQFQLPQCRYNMIRAILTIKKNILTFRFIHIILKVC